MTISTQEAVNALYVSGANATINYTKYISSEIPDIVFYVSSSATTFYLDVIPTSSVDTISFYRQDNSIINETNKLRLNPNTQIKIPVIARIDSSNFDNVVVNQKDYDIRFELMPVELPPPPPQTGATGGGRVAGGGDGRLQNEILVT